VVAPDLTASREIKRLQPAEIICVSKEQAAELAVMLCESWIYLFTALLLVGIRE